MNEFSRQWFPPGCQVGLTMPAQLFEHQLNRRDFEGALNTLESQIESAPFYWARQHKRVRRLQSKKDDFIKLCFKNFWPDMNPRDCQLLDLFRLATGNTRVVIVDCVDECDIVVYSCYGENADYFGKDDHAERWLFLGENVRPNFFNYDYCLSSDLSAYCGRNSYLPLWLLELDWFKRSVYNDRKTYPIERFSKRALFDYKNRKDSVLYVGNNEHPLRESIMQLLVSEGIIVDKFGSQTKPVKDKIQLLRNYKVTLCFENSISPGYVTEKIIHPFLAGTHMLYWGGMHEVDCLASNNPLFIWYRDDLSTSDLLASIRKVFTNQSSLYVPALLNRSRVNNIFYSLLSDIRSRTKKFST